VVARIHRLVGLTSKGGGLRIGLELGGTAKDATRRDSGIGKRGMIGCAREVAELRPAAIRHQRGHQVVGDRN
jgi:hypothetical protein